MKTAFITGANGYTNRAIVRELSAHGLRAVAHVRSDSPRLAEWTTRFSALGAQVDSTPWQADALQAICTVWPRGVIDDDFKTPLLSNKPVLLLSGEADPITPPHYAEQVAATLGNVKHLTGVRQGHGQVMRGCMPDIVGRFVDSAKITDLAEDCFNRVFAMPFFLDFSGPSP